MRRRLADLLHLLRTEHTSPGRLAAAVFVGLFFGIVPLYGVQTPICLAVATGLRLNRALVVGVAQVSNPLFAPALVAAGVGLGEWLRYGRLHPFDLEEGASLARAGVFGLGGLGDLAVSCFLGDTVLALAAGAGGAALTYAWAARRAATGSGGLRVDPGGDRAE